MRQSPLFLLLGGEQQHFGLDVDQWMTDRRPPRALEQLSHNVKKATSVHLYLGYSCHREENRPKTGDLLVKLERLVKMHSKTIHRRENEELTVLIPSGSRSPAPPVMFSLMSDCSELLFLKLNVKTMSILSTTVGFHKNQQQQIEKCRAKYRTLRDITGN